MWSDARFHERTYQLRAGDVVEAYTDGLLEAHAPDRVLAPEDLVALASDCHRQPLNTCIRGLEGAALGSSIEPVRDDIAILALRVRSPAPARQVATAGIQPRQAYSPNR